MNSKIASSHFVTVGAPQNLIENLWQRVAEASRFRFSHIAHPAVGRDLWENGPAPQNVHFFSADGEARMPDVDRQLLASLECVDVPTVHNMILSDRALSKLDSDEALSYATFLAQRLVVLFEEIQPWAIIGARDGLHGSLTLAVARKMQLPWFALSFSVIPPGLACFCDRMSPAARVRVCDRPPADMDSLADAALLKFESRKIRAPAYIAPLPRNFTARIAALPARASALVRTLRKSRRGEYLKFVEVASGHNVWAAWRQQRLASKARSALAMSRSVSVPPSVPYTLFALHTQPESSIDVLAPFFSNQMWVIELLARSIPPTHKLLVKIHKSDMANYSAEQLERMRSFPGVQLVAPHADTRAFIESADLLFSIQGTIGLEAALLGKPVIVLGDSPVNLFPSASPIGKITELPELVRLKLSEHPPTRSSIQSAYREFLAPFAPASYNDWTVIPEEREIQNFVDLFSALGRYLVGGGSAVVKAEIDDS